VTDRTLVSMICIINPHIQIKKRPARNCHLPSFAMLSGPTSEAPLEGEATIYDDLS
jgi:hypothetical protein